MAFMTLLPTLLHITITMVMKNIFIYSLDEIQYEIWVFPGIVILISILSIYSVIYRDLFNLRIHKKAFIPITLAPYSKPYLVIAILISAIIESLLYGSIAMIILSFFFPQALHWSAYAFIPIYSFIFLLLFGNLVLTFSILVERISSFLFLTIILFFFIIFGTGIIVEFEFYPKLLGMILSYNPFSMVLSELRGFLFFDQINLIFIAVPILVALGWTWLNGYILKRKLKQ